MPLLYIIALYIFCDIVPPANPCEPTPTYNFAQCVEEQVTKKAGCKLPWTKFDVEGLPLCDNMTMLKHYSHMHFQNLIHESNSLSKIMSNTGCSMPCSYMEYKVSIYIVSTLVDASFLINQKILDGWRTV